MSTTADRRPARRARRIGRVVTVAVAAAAAVSACGSDGPSKEEAYCDTVRANLVALEDPAIATAADIETTLDLYRSITEGAPLAVQPEWQVVTENIATAATVDPGDPESRQRAADTARRSQSAASRIQQYTHEACSVDIGTPPATTNPVTATTLVPPGDTSGG